MKLLLPPPPPPLALAPLFFFNAGRLDAFFFGLDDGSSSSSSMSSSASVVSGCEWDEEAREKRPEEREVERARVGPSSSSSEGSSISSSGTIKSSSSDDLDLRAIKISRQNMLSRLGFTTAGCYAPTFLYWRFFELVELAGKRGTTILFLVLRVNLG